MTTLPDKLNDLDRVTSWSAPTDKVEEAVQICPRCQKIRERRDDVRCPYCGQSFKGVPFQRIRMEKTFAAWLAEERSRMPRFRKAIIVAHNGLVAMFARRIA